MFLVEAAVILIVAKLAGELASRLDQPPVLGQLLGGLALGTALPFFFGSAFEAVDAQVSELSALGVILLMFLAGLETDWDQLRSTGKPAFVAACLGVVVPLVGGYFLALAFGLPALEALFVGVILTATSVSITAQTLMELGRLQTLEGATVLGAAVIDDVLGLVVFSVVVALTGAQQTNLLVLFGLLVAFFGLSWLVGPRLIGWALERAERLRGTEAALAIALAIALLYGAAAERAGLAAITGAYTAGLLVNRSNRHPQLVERTRILTYGLFVPIFLVKTGMDAHLDALGPLLLFVIATSIVAVLTKVVGSGLGARACGLSARQSLVVGVGMISRGEVALVVASLALSGGMISREVFGAMVIVVLVTTLVTPPLLRLALPDAPPLPGLVSDPAQVT
jgi:Kef-type K+ transport system membrane component KefB